VIFDFGTQAETNVPGVKQLLLMPFSEDISELGAILELSHPSQMEIF